MKHPSPKPARRRCDLVFLDPVAAWRALPPRAQEEIGATAIAAAVAVAGAQLLTDTADGDARPYDTAADEAQQLLDAVVDLHVLRQSRVVPLLPDLRPLGILQCQGCGCTDSHPCDSRCRWVAKDLCSACAPVPA